MWRRLYNRKAQSTGEYALVFAIILGAIVAMQTYVKKGVQGRVKSGTDYMARETQGLGKVTQYDPYDFSSDYKIARESKVQEKYTGGESYTGIDKDETTRETGGYTEYGPAVGQDVGEEQGP